jgi:hypothetical protein
MPIDDADARDRRARIERVMEHYRLAKERRLARRALRLWQEFEGRQALVSFETPPERVH